MERRRDRLQELVEQCEDEELMDIVLPRLTKVLSLWELLLAKVEGGGPARTRFPDIYCEFESLQAQVRQAAQEYIVSPQSGAMPLEVRNIEVARSLGILDELNRMKVVPGASPSSSLTNKNVRYMENSKMLPPSKRFKMENSVPVHQNGIETPRAVGTAVTSVTSNLKPCSVSVSPLMIPAASKQLTTTADSTSSSSGSTSAKMPSTQAPPAVTPTPMEVSPGEDQPMGPLKTDAQVEPPKTVAQLTPLKTDTQVEPLKSDAQVELLSASQDQVLSTSDITAQMKVLEKVLDSSSKTTVDSKTPESSSTQTPESSSAQTPESSSTQTPESSSVQTPAFSSLQQKESGSADPCEPKELQEGQEIYIQTEGLTVQLAEPGLDRIVIVNGPDGTTMHIQTPEGVPLEAVQALLGIEASDGAKAPQ